MYEAIGHCGSSQYPVLFNPRIGSNLPAITVRGDLHMCALLIDALSHGKSEIVMPKKLGKRIQNCHEYYSKLDLQSAGSSPDLHKIMCP